MSEPFPASLSAGFVVGVEKGEGALISLNNSRACVDLIPFGQRNSVNGFLVTHCAQHKGALYFSLLTPFFLFFPPHSSNKSPFQHFWSQASFLPLTAAAFLF